MTVTVAAPAKINLSLDIGCRQPDGYHPVQTVMQAVSLCDTVRVSLAPGSGLELTCSDPALPCDGGNTACRAAAVFAAARGAAGRIAIHIEKRIPAQAGLAGGSTDAAAVLTALNRLTGSPFDEPALARMAAAVGADVPFCLRGGTCLATGIGTVLSAAPPLPDCCILLAKPPEGVSTADAYAAADQAPPAKADGTPAVLAALRRHDLTAVGAALSNRFAQVLSLPRGGQLCALMRQAGAAGACLSGSGSAVFGLFAREADAAACAAALPADCFTALCRPHRAGAEIISC
ncbi:MAG: 4-(cytidine 5'-diphospho)-2-C-methyl-D-erythritol kinase [Clostridia bacterium]|nr:4-(cytidine 5'-diphospho)-2-C-methyl-D-erythritol kinase [Clostridia bacterium]